MKALIFDIDGTVAETEELHRAAFNAAFPAFDLNWHWDRETYRSLLTTTGGKERIFRHANETGAGAVPVAALHAEKTRLFTRLIDEGITLRPGIGTLMQDARAAGLRLAAATTTSPENVEALCHAAFNLPASQVFDVIAAGDMVAAKKPAPDVYMLALDLLGLAPHEAIAFEDSANGVRSAREAGLAVILSRGFYTLQEPIGEASLCVDCFSELGGLDGLTSRLEALA
ncbi:HAD-IA family hydrolase [Xanthobacter sp. TB0139]|uniref:HAD-IA family hydrolase n=1 Tax=Xanthobacter sp. TB0139 TaxID=3459178 RepID=UPI00403A0AB5